MSPTTPKHSDGNVPPDNWEIATAAAAKKAAAIIAQAKEHRHPSRSQDPRASSVFTLQARFPLHVQSCELY
eukprot:1862843-Amphidinium_carterae.1